MQTFKWDQAVIIGLQKETDQSNSAQLNLKKGVFSLWKGKEKFSTL